MRKPMIAANWKMYKTPEEAERYAHELLPLLAGQARADLVICPPYLALQTLVRCFEQTSIAVGAQNMHSEDEGAFTGEISAPMLLSIGVKHTILGHSERRHYNGETDWDVNRKLHAALSHGMTPIVCVGEVQEEREEGRTNDVLERQVKIALEGIKPADAAPIVIAYEPVWAIGSGQTATPDVAAEAHEIVRSAVRDRLGNEIAEGMRILYGGSVKPANASGLLCHAEIDGALIGGASLDPKSFASIIHCEDQVSA